MRRRVIFLLMLLGFIALSMPLPRAQSGSQQEVKILPRYQTAEELANEAKFDGAGSYPWECNPTLYGFSPEPGPSYYFPSEWDSTTGVLIGWPTWGDRIPELWQLVAYSLGRADVTIVTNIRPQVEAFLRSLGFDDYALSFIKWTPSPLPVDTIWFRDYGPEVVNDYFKGTRALIDMSYYPGPTPNCAQILNRPNDDASPTRLTQLGGPEWAVSVHRPQVRAEGGNLQTDGFGTCFRTRRVTLLQNQFSRWFYTQEQLDEVFSRYYNCGVAVMESMVGVIDHIDMWMTVISPTKILVGQYDPADDPMNAAILDQNAQTLSDAGYSVVRVPMPRPYCSDGGFPQLPGRTRLCGTTYEARRVWGTYVNSIRIGNAMMVPVYRDVPEVLRAEIEAQEAAALAIFQQELDVEYGPGAVEVIPVNSDTMITGQGSLHCVTITYK